MHTPFILQRMARPASGWLGGVLAALAFSLLSWLAIGLPAAAQDFLDPEKAFVFSARAVDDRQLEVRFQIARGYYMYRERLAFEATGATLQPAQLPAGKLKFDETFNKEVETYRDDLRIRIPYAATAPFELKVTSQGCADAGLCYPPQTTTARIVPVAAVAGGGGPAAAPGTAAGTAPGGTQGWLAGLSAESVLATGSFWAVVGGFLAMGLLLSLTPCVLPMLPILSSLLVGGGPAPSRGRGLALAGSYSLGMALVYTGLGVAAGLAGEGLAAYLQAPWMLLLFAALMAGLALSMFDVYELRLPAAFTERMTTSCNRTRAGHLAGVFGMGAISALIVSPCVSAPLAGALLFISQQRDVALGGTALFAMAAGMSVPLLLLGASAGRLVPKAGAWMNAVKRAFGLLLLGVAIWIAQPVLPGAAALVLWGLLLLATGFMLRPFEPTAHPHAPRVWAQRALGLGALVFGAAQLLGAAAGGADPLKPLAPLAPLAPGGTPLAAGAQAARPATAPGAAPTGTAVAGAPVFRRVKTSAELDAALASPGRPVMLDFYADWCVSCKEMERFTFTDPAVAQAMAGAVLLKVDVTANDAADRELLKRFNLFGPPGTIFFDASGREIAGTRVIGFQDAQRFRQTLARAGL